MQTNHRANFRQSGGREAGAAQRLLNGRPTENSPSSSPLALPSRGERGDSGESHLSVAPKFVLSLLALLSALPALPAAAAAFGDDVAFLEKHTEIITLSDESGQAQVALAPAWQGRIVTSTAAGPGGLSYGWINRALIASGEIRPHVNFFGGEDRIWLGPEGGQFSIFFVKGAPFDMEHWQTPAPIDTEPYQVVGKAKDQAHFRHAFQLANYSGTVFDLQVDRRVRLVTPSEVWEDLAAQACPGLSMVAFESRNKITNRGEKPWTKETGLLSIWILGMFHPSPATTVVIPVRPGAEEELGPRVNADYFGRVPPDRLAVSERAVFFRGDGKRRGKIGISPKRALPILGSYDAARQVLTLVQFTLPPGATDYVNSMFEIQEEPFAGDVVNSYNDGPLSPSGEQLGPFYELETSSPAAALGPSESLEHVHRTIHLTGSRAELEEVARVTLRVGLDEITGALPPVQRRPESHHAKPSK